MEKSKLSIVIVGHVDHGKSTLIGRLMYDTNSISEDKINELRKVSLMTDNKLEFAFLLDHLKEEREQGISIDTTQTFFKTEKREFQIIDAPGHIEFIKNMLTGAAQADTAILIIDANEGVMQQTRRHTFILSLLGISQIVVVINKMDKIGYSEEVFNDTVLEAKKIFEKLNMHASHFIPISALNGDNVCVASQNMNWYHGKTVLSIMEEMETPKNRNDSPYIFSVQDVYKVGEKRVAVGRLETGILHKNDSIQVVQTGQKTRVASIEKFLEDPEEVYAGECIGIVAEDALFFERGNVVCQDNADIDYVDEFEASIIWMDQKSVQVGEKLQIRCDNQETSCSIKKIISKLNTGQLVEETDRYDVLCSLDAGKVIISTKKKIAISKFKQNRCIGRFVILRDDNICAGGIII